jgi:hypothetical protein
LGLMHEVSLHFCKKLFQVLNPRPHGSKTTTLCSILETTK